MASRPSIHACSDLRGTMCNAIYIALKLLILKSETYADWQRVAQMIVEAVCLSPALFPQEQDQFRQLLQHAIISHIQGSIRVAIEASSPTYAPPLAVQQPPSPHPLPPRHSPHPLPTRVTPPRLSPTQTVSPTPTYSKAVGSPVVQRAQTLAVPSMTHLAPHMEPPRRSSTIAGPAWATAAAKLPVRGVRL